MGEERGEGEHGLLLLQGCAVAGVDAAMAILYALVARGTIVLAEFSAVTGNTGAVARRILEKLPPDSDSRLCFSQERYIFHVLRSDGITFLCMANDTFGSKSSLALSPGK